MTMTTSGPQWLKNVLDETLLNRWWDSLDYESKWAVTCLVARELGGPLSRNSVALVGLRGVKL